MMVIRVLHVEDEPDLREIVEVALGHPDLVTRSCGSGQEAIVIVINWSPDIILLDVMMPEMDGPTTLTRLRSNAHTARIPVVFMTAHAQHRTRPRAQFRQRCDPEVRRQLSSGSSRCGDCA